MDTDANLLFFRSAMGSLGIFMRRMRYLYQNDAANLLYIIFRNL